jgi:hypothetical protein
VIDHPDFTVGISLILEVSAESADFGPQSKAYFCYAAALLAGGRGNGTPGLRLDPARTLGAESRYGRPTAIPFGR